MWYHFFVESKMYTNEIIYPVESYSQKQKTVIHLLKRNGGETGKIRSLGLIYTYHYM